MAAAVAQQQPAAAAGYDGSSAGVQQRPPSPIAISVDGIKLYPKFSYPQPVPFQRIPTAAGALPSWEQKKLELDTANLDIADGTRRSNGEDAPEPVLAETRETDPPVVAAEQAKPATSTPAVAPNGHARSASYSKLQKSSPGAKKPTFLGSIRSASSRDSTVQHVRNASYASKTGGIGYNPTDGAVASSRSSEAPQSTLKRPKNPFLRFIQRNFSSKYAAEQERLRQNGQRPQQASGVQVSTVPQSYQSGKKGERGIGNTLHTNNNNAKKTRSTGFAQKMKDASGKVTSKIQETFTRYDSKTPKEQLPKTWEEWRRAYARGDIDITDMPRPPARDTGSSDPSPEEAGFLAAPKPENHRERQLAFNRLDIEGKRGGVKASQIAVPEGEEPLPDSLEGHPAFRNIVTQARALFDSAISILTVFNEDKQLFLAETGLGGMKEVPREVTFCSHAVLQRPPQPFILNDTHEDWRFSKSPLVTGYGCRAYYGVPLLAPDFSGNSREPIPIGTLCIIDNKPRDDFTPEQRSKMGDLALLAQKTIANWSRARLQARLDLMEKSFLQWRTETQALTQMGAGQTNIYSSDMEGSARAIGMTSLTSLQHQQKAVGEGKTLDGDDASRFSEIPNTPAGIEPRDQQAQGSPASPALRKQPSQRSTRAGPPPTSDIPPLPVANGSANADDILHISKPAETPMSGASESYVTAPAVPTNNKQKIYDISTRLVGTSLELTLVYILRLEFANETRGTESPASASDVKSLSLISAFGLPSPEPAFDAILHLKALRSEEGGLLYQNPNIDDLVSGEKLPNNEEVEYASALLVPVAESGKAGYVLAGFTDDPERVFERSDLEYMHTIASELAIYLGD